MKVFGGEEGGKEGARVLARSLYREMRANGYNMGFVIAVASALIGLVTEHEKSAA